MAFRLICYLEFFYNYFNQNNQLFVYLYIFFLKKRWICEKFIQYCCFWKLRGRPDQAYELIAKIQESRPSLAATSSLQSLVMEMRKSRVTLVMLYVLLLLKLIWLWHQCLAHPSFGYIKHILPALFGSYNKESKYYTCETVAKNHHSKFPKSDTVTSMPFTLIYRMYGDRLNILLLVVCDGLLSLFMIAVELNEFIYLSTRVM